MFCMPVMGGTHRRNAHQEAHLFRARLQVVVVVVVAVLGSSSTRSTRFPRRLLFASDTPPMDPAARKGNNLARIPFRITPAF